MGATRKQLEDKKEREIRKISVTIMTPEFKTKIYSL